MIGDVHSHVDEPAFSSATDVRDERHRPGLHIVVGRISHEPPDFHIEATVDGMRFHVTHPELVLEGYERRRIAAVPPTWIDQVEVRHWTGDGSSVRIHPVDSPSSPSADEVNQARNSTRPNAATLPEEP